MPINDYMCMNCTTEFKDEFTTPAKCEVCGATDFELATRWCDRRVGKKDNTKYCTDGVTINRFQAKHDPLCQIELGLRSANGTSLRTFTPEQAAYYRAKVKVDDSYKTRQEILEVRARNESERKLKRIERNKQL